MKHVCINVVVVGLFISYFARITPVISNTAQIIHQQLHVSPPDRDPAVLDVHSAKSA